jgi:hypothetical protein
MNTSLLFSSTIALVRTAGPRLVVQLVIAAWRDAATDVCRRVGGWLGRHSVCTLAAVCAGCDRELP